MGIFDKLLKRSKPLSPVPSLFTLASTDPNLPALTVDNALDKNSDLYAVINRIASDVASCPIIIGNQWQTILNNPNPLFSRFNFWQNVMAQLLLTGNAIVTLGDRLELIPYTQVSMLLNDDASDITYTVTYDDGRPRQEFQASEVLHFKLMGTGALNSQYVGFSPLTALIPDIELQELSKNLTKTVLNNGLNPRFLLSTPQVITDNKAKKALRDNFEKLNTGVNNRRAIFTDAGLSISTLNVSQDVSTYLKNYNFSQDQIAKAFGVPSSYLNGTGDQQSSVEMLRSMYTDSLQTYIKPIESEISLKLKAPARMDITQAVDVDGSQLIDKVTKLVQAGIISADEAHQILVKKGALDG